jgi:hypothetical protein
MLYDLEWGEVVVVVAVVVVIAKYRSQCPVLDSELRTDVNLLRLSLRDSELVNVTVIYVVRPVSPDLGHAILNLSLLNIRVVELLTPLILIQEIPAEAVMPDREGRDRHGRQKRSRHQGGHQPLEQHLVLFPPHFIYYEDLEQSSSLTLPNTVLVPTIAPLLR